MAKEYDKDFLDKASKLDAVTESCGEMTDVAKKIVQTLSEDDIRALWLFLC